MDGLIPIVYDTGHRTGTRVVSAFAAGMEACGVRPETRIIPPTRHLSVFDGTRGSVVYGKLRGASAIFHATIKAGRPAWYIDNGYLSPGHFDGYYRVCLNAMQSPDLAPPSAQRLAAIKHPPLAPWRKDGDHILVCPPVPEYNRTMHFHGPGWLGWATSYLGFWSSRPLRIRYKPGDPRAPNKTRTLAGDLVGCWAVVTHDSNIVIEALIAGVPCFATGPTCADGLVEPNLTAIERPLMPDTRSSWLERLAANQWTLAEMADGTTWKAVSK